MTNLRQPEDFRFYGFFWKQRYSGINGSYDEDVENNLLSGDAFGDGMRLQPFTGENVKKVDICVYGGTSAGVIAAYTARQAGKSVLLIEPGRHLGGMSSGGLGYTDIGNKYVIRGLALDFYRRLGRHYGKLEQWIFEPKEAEAVFNEYIRRADVEVWYDSRIVRAANRGG